MIAELGVDRGGHVHPWRRPQKVAPKVKPQVTTQNADPRMRGGCHPGVDMSTPVHPKWSESPTAHDAPVRRADAKARIDHQRAADVPAETPERVEARELEDVK